MIDSVNGGCRINKCYIFLNISFFGKKNLNVTLPVVIFATVALCSPILVPKLGFRRVTMKFLDP